MKNKNLSWVGALFVFALLLWCTHHAAHHAAASRS